MSFAFADESTIAKLFYIVPAELKYFRGIKAKRPFPSMALTLRTCLRKGRDRPGSSSYEQNLVSRL